MTMRSLDGVLTKKAHLKEKYTEEQLNNCYRHYCLHQVRKDFSFMKLEDFRLMFEDIMAEVYSENE